jgi:streptomycin 3"-adenylyltransferase
MDQPSLVTAVVRDVLGGNLIGAYLHGSATSGGLRPTSDIDVLGVIGRPTTTSERAALIERLLPVSRPR